MLTPDQRRKRAFLGIGASQSAAALGLSRYSTPLDEYSTIVAVQDGVIDPDRDDAPSPMAAMGNDIEPALARTYERLTGLSGEYSPDTIVSEAYPWMFAHADWRGADRVAEFKLHGGEGYGEPGTDEVPQEVLVQVHHQMICARVELAQVGVLKVQSGGRKRNDSLVFDIYDVPLQSELAALIIDGTKVLWDRVQRRDPPPPMSPADAIKLWARASKAINRTATDEIAMYVQQASDLAMLRKKLEEQEELLRNEIGAFMQEADTLVAPNGRPLVTWKASKPPVRFDKERLKAEHPLLYAQYETIGQPSRRMLFK